MANKDQNVVNNAADDKMTEPLLRGEQNLADENGGSGKKTGSKDSLYMVYLSTLVAVSGSYSFGTGVGYSSPTQNAIREDLSLSLAEYSVFGSILTFGAMIGAITSGPIADFIGRKGAMRVSSFVCIAGWLAIYFSEGALSLDLGRLATGYGMGIFSYVVPVFTAEIAPKELRGALTSANQLLIVIGASTFFIIGTVATWRTLALVGVIPCAVLLLGLFLIPESPRWLAKIGKHEEFEAALQKLRGKDADISQEATEIQIGVGLMVIQQFGGINAIAFYAANIFQTAGLSPSTGTISYALLQVVVTFFNIIMIDRAGRKPLLLFAATGLLLGCLLLAAAFFLKVYIGSFSSGMGATPWVLMSEIFPINIKGVGGSLTTLVNWFGAWAISYTFNFLETWSSYGTFLLYAAVNILGIVFITTVVPETKGRTLEEIQATMNM
ncbi:Sugar transporter ERD6-like 7 [Citrus sinensis]|uniref:Sugar transporter ERD6-like 7 n=1 Tax=Citrus sinensis TaxID=2711 RepID=A0ACB8MJV1_CITSI|nr:Sugar transporter ERD6-like 7 [Citrus sinensis]KAH9786061.1 Sugar transporter ERD6-like 7 [Citrus sinensis]